MSRIGYTETSPGGPIGTRNPPTRLAASGVEPGEVKWVDHGQQKREVQLGLPVCPKTGTKAVIVAAAPTTKDR